jgi:hypothetical protein
MGLSRISLPFIVGTFFTGNRDRAVVVGLGVNFAAGWTFALVYCLIFQSWHRATWWLGGLLGIAHAFIILLILMPFFPSVHPRMATEQRGPEPTRALEPPGFLALNYGRPTPVVSIVAHMIYGGILGASYHLIS